MRPSYGTAPTARSESSPVLWITSIGLVIGSAIGLLLVSEKKKRKKKSTAQNNDNDIYLQHLISKRKRLPDLVLLLRHGESEANADHTLWRNKPDNLISLTKQGRAQARAAGERIEDVFLRFEQQTGRSIKRVHINVSPFERTLQTAAEARRYFEHRVVRTSPESRLREQEFGNLSQKDSKLHREQQERVGRFWYRFPTGESGCDVLDRVKSWWSDSFLTVNERVGYDPVDAVVVVTHGLTMRFILMQLYNWSPNTFHSVWNAGNCDLYILRKDLSKPGIDPFVLDPIHGDKPESTIDLIVSTIKKDEGEETTLERQFKLYDYLSIPPPRTVQIRTIKERLVEQYPEEIGSVEEIQHISFKPFIDAERTTGTSYQNVPTIVERRTLSQSSHESIIDDQDVFDQRLLLLGQLEDDDDDVIDDNLGRGDDRSFTKATKVIPEKSFRWPCRY